MEATKKGFDFKKFMSDNAMWFVLVILAIALTAVRPKFLTVGNLTTLISSESVKGIITCGVCWCILSAGIDLGPGAVAALSAVVSASLAQQADLPTRLISVHMPAVVCILVAMVIGAIVGIICGWLVFGNCLLAASFLKNSSLVRSIPSRYTEPSSKVT